MNRRSRSRSRSRRGRRGIRAVRAFGSPRGPAIGDCVRVGIRSVPRVIGIGLLLAAWLFATAVASVFAMLVLGFARTPALSLILVGPLLVFGVGALLCRHAVAVPAAVVER